MSGELGVLIIGAGRVSRAHAHAVRETPGTRLVAVADIALDRAEALAGEGATAYVDYLQALERSDVQVVMIALPHNLHESVTVRSLRAGKHVFVEKPMADTIEECDRMIDAARLADRLLFVAHTQRYFASTIEAKRILQSGEIGRPIFATDTWYKAFGIETRPPWFLDRAQGGGMWLMNGAHMIDRTCWVLDSDVESVKAWIGSPFHGISADDANIALLRLRNGCHATIVHAGFRRGVDRCEVEVTCTGGMLLFDSYSNRLAVDEAGAYRSRPLTPVHPMSAELQNLVGAIRGEDVLGVTPEWGRHIVDVLLGCEESTRTGREVTIRSRGILGPVGASRH
ncbi:MAG: Gfo/Idh/MocA family oxidoreductase [Chloroflexi bacterium]|nr:Gfo/Idh/MocA family oxidoreductase [Chloroflexota bacterium]